ncbi:DUF1292 domain-containing protein [Pectinatus sottacetonis]|uniref:DUF1292 domain-containing protein n=1 Tax=Pectinatus sottacetonis TaxID=1002795 RepID=UPI0018C5039F|nr:DUF1292 domain-containing protein [Pectinatus sottacetonis]
MEDDFKIEQNNNDEGNIIEMTDEEGNKHYFYEEMQFSAGNNRYALLSVLDEEREAPEGLEENDNTIAKVIINDAGEEEYYSPKDDEFDMAVSAYEALMQEND